MNANDNLSILVGNDEARNGSGAYVLAGQDTAGEQGFRNVSQTWYDKTLSFDDGLKVLREKSANCHDIVTDARSLTFGIDNAGKLATNIDGHICNPDSYGGKKLLSWMNVGESLWAEYADGDNGDIEMLVRALRNGQRKYTEEKKLLFRCDGDRLRFVASDSYAPVSNVWYVETMAELIPGGRLSHFDFADASTLYGNILIPDTIRKESDSEYGAMIATCNCEIGKRSLASLASLFRAICMNGMIHGAIEGTEYRRRHRGTINLAEVKRKLASNIQQQIPLSVAMIDKLLATKMWDAPANITTLFAAITESSKIAKKTALDAIAEWHTQGSNRTAFGAIDALTRAGQQQSAAEWTFADTVAGEIVSNGAEAWNGIIARANSYTVAQVNKILSLSA